MRGFSIRLKVLMVALIVLFLGASGLLAMGMAVAQIWYGLSARTWPVVEATVQHAIHHRPEMPAFTNDLEFAYEVDNFPYRSERVRFNQPITDLANWEVAMLYLRHPIGSKVTLRYNPRDPAVAVLETGVSTRVALPFGVGLAMVVITAFAGWIILRDDAVAGLLMMALVFTGLGLGLLLPGAAKLWRIQSSREWPTVEGRIIRYLTNVPEADKEPPLIYQYAVDGKTYFGNRRFFPHLDSAQDGWRTDLYYHYRVGQTVQVHYDPADPWASVLEPVIRDDDWYLPIGGAAFLFFGLVTGFASLVSARRR